MLAPAASKLLHSAIMVCSIALRNWHGLAYPNIFMRLKEECVDHMLSSHCQVGNAHAYISCRLARSVRSRRHAG